MESQVPKPSGSSISIEGLSSDDGCVSGVSSPVGVPPSGAVGIAGGTDGAKDGASESGHRSLFPFPEDGAFVLLLDLVGVGWNVSLGAGDSEGIFVGDIDVEGDVDKEGIPVGPADTLGADDLADFLELFVGVGADEVDGAGDMVGKSVGDEEMEGETEVEGSIVGEKLCVGEADIVGAEVFFDFLDFDDLHAVGAFVDFDLFFHFHSLSEFLWARFVWPQA